jgi:hypothetical protein
MHAADLKSLFMNRAYGNAATRRTRARVFVRLPFLFILTFLGLFGSCLSYTQRKEGGGGVSHEPRLC